jgi:hypothetical protein
MVSYSMPGMTNENNENISGKIASLWAEFSNPTPCEYEAHTLITQSQCSAK